MGKEITYILGAGASYYSMPLVENFANRFDLFKAFLFSVPDYDQKKQLINDIADFSKEIRYHISFDTFFKKIFHSNDSLAIKYKPVLLLFFIFEHTVNINDYAEKFSGHDFERYGEKKYNRDPRYDALIAGLLQPIKNVRSFYAKINFITWNYDLNLLDSLRSYIYPSMQMNVFLKDKGEKNFFDFDGKVSVIHLNGYMNHSTFDTIDPLGISELIEYFRKLIDLYLDNPSTFVSYSQYLKFSWESIAENEGDLTKIKYLQKAKEAVNHSHNIVVIGYSFPLYNRLIDKEFIDNRIMANKHIYIQDPKAESINNIFATDFGLKNPENTIDIYTKKNRPPRFNIITLSDCKSFFVPSSLLP